VATIALFNGVTCQERAFHFGTLDEAPALDTAVNRLANAVALEYLRLRAKPVNSGLGSAGKRSQEQKVAARAYAKQLIADVVPTSLVGFTDGSAIGNPGPCGAGVFLYDNTDPDWAGDEAIGALGPGSNNIGELWAVGMAIDLANRRLEAGPLPHTITHLYNFTDSQYSIGCLTRGWQSASNAGLVKSVKQAIDSLPPHIIFVLQWVPAHVGIPENEQADLLAGLGSARSHNNHCNIDTSILGMGFLPPD
jgi:ribonuclease HI